MPCPVGHGIRYSILCISNILFSYQICTVPSYPPCRKPGRDLSPRFPVLFFSPNGYRACAKETVAPTDNPYHLTNQLNYFLLAIASEAFKARDVNVHPYLRVSRLLKPPSNIIPDLIRPFRDWSSIFRYIQLPLGSAVR